MEIRPETARPRGFAPAARAAVEPFYVMKVWAAAAERAARGERLFNLAAGQPSTPAPRPVLAALHSALDKQILGYTEAPGIMPLRESIARHYRVRYGMEVDPANVVVTTGSSGGFLLAFLSAFDVGARVGLARPGYPAYRNLLAALGCEVVDLPCGPDTRFQPTVAMLDGLGLDGLVLASPANPTGTMLSPHEVATMATYCAERGIRLVSDEIYHGITYADATAANHSENDGRAAENIGPDPLQDDHHVAGAGAGAGAEDGARGVGDGTGDAAEGVGRPVSAWATDRSGFVVNSFSKYFSMTGWRIGWMLVPDDLVDAVDAIAGNAAICPPAPAQFAALAAFDAYDECDGHVARYAKNRELLLTGLRELGFDRMAPADGAFYVYADVSHLTDDSEALCWDVLHRVGVATAPGRDFDPVDGHRYLRMSFAGDAETLRGALDAWAEYLRDR